MLTVMVVVGLLGGWWAGDRRSRRLIEWGMMDGDVVPAATLLTATRLMFGLPIHPPLYW